MARDDLDERELEHTGGDFAPTCCPSCTGPKSPTLDLCEKCREYYGNQRGAWPEWLQVLVRDSDNWANAQRQARRYEIPAGLRADPSEDLPAKGDDIVTDPGAMAFSVGPGGGLLLPNAPYSDESLNEIYRVANHIIGTVPPPQWLDLESTTTTTPLEAARDWWNRVKDHNDPVRSEPDFMGMLPFLAHLEMPLEEARELSRFCRTLTYRQSCILIMYFVLGWRQEWIAEGLGLSRAAVTQHWRVVLDKAKKFGLTLDLNRNQ
ncbi:MAG: sigma-70 family RNA polymerase sigma factor [Anaerolineae bacterium]|nr:sigma-70 family RNA polymerase sigma factor [Anaerolineae bacterium]